MGTGGKGAGAGAAGAGARTGAPELMDSTSRLLLLDSDRLQDEVNNMRDLIRRLPVADGLVPINLPQAKRLRAALDELELAAERIVDRAIVRGVSISRPLGSLAMAVGRAARGEKPVDILPANVPDRVRGNFYNGKRVAAMVRRAGRLVNSARRVARVISQ